MTRTIRLASVCLLLVLGFIAHGVTSAGGPVCAGAPPSQLHIGEQAQRPLGPDSNIRAEPNTRADFLGQIPAGGIVKVVDGPVCADGYSWWKVNYQGMVGWTPEGIGTDYWLEPLNAPVSATPTFVYPTATPEIFGLTLKPHEPLILFLSTSDPFGGQQELFVMNPDGSNVRPLISGMWAGSPSWSPDGTKIAFSSAMGITVLETDTGKTHVLISNEGEQICEGWSLDLAWSPDSQQMLILGVFNSGDTQGCGNSYDLFIVNADGTNVKNLTNTPTSWESNPSWSPDGSQIVFVSERRDAGNPCFQLFTMNRDGSNVQPLPADVCAFANQPVWSPDGEHIALQTDLGVSILNLKTGTLWKSGVQTSYPVWSADGSQLAFTGIRAGSSVPQENQVYVVDADGSHIRILSEKPVFDTSPSWSPDNQELLVQTLNMNIYAIPLDGEGAWRFLGKSTEYPAAAVWRPSVQTTRG